MIHPIREEFLSKHIRGKVFLYPLVGLVAFCYLILVIPFVAIWSFRKEGLEDLNTSLALMLCKVK